MARIEWVDGGIAYAFTNGLPGPGSRFGAWTPGQVEKEDRHETLAGGLEVGFTFGTYPTVTFEVREVAACDLPRFYRLRAWLLDGQAVRLVTEDRRGRAYAATLQPGTKPSHSAPDPRTFRYTCSFAFAGVADAPMVVEY